MRRAVAVLGFKNATERPGARWLSTAIAEMLTTDIAAGGQLRTIPGEAVALAARDLGLAEAEEPTKDGLARLKRVLGADFVVWGSYTSIGEKQRPLLRIDVRLHDAGSGELAASSSATGTEEQLFDLVSRAGNTVREKLGLGRVSPAEALAVEASLPGNREAARLYAEGLAKLRLADALGARDVLEKAAVLDPKHPMPHAALAAAWTALGYEGKALEQAKQAAALSGDLPPLEKLAIEARFQEASKEWEKAIASYRSLLVSTPDNLEVGLRLAEVQVTAGKAKEAVVTAESLRKLPRPASDDPRIDYIHALALRPLASYKEQQALAARAAAKAEAQGSRALQAAARLLEATALQSLGQSPQALAAIEDSRTLAEAAGDRAGVGRALLQMGVAQYRRGDYEGAKKLFERSVAIHREIGDKRTTARSLLNLANTRLGQGDLPGAQALYTECLATFREIGAKQDVGLTLNDVGARLHNLGELSEAEKKYREALSVFGEIGHRRYTAMTLTNLAELQYLRGDLGRAREMHEESLAIRREVGDKSGAGYDLHRLGLVFAAQGDLNVARDRYRESLELRRELGQKVTAAETQVAIAQLAAAEGKAQEAETLAREAEEVLRAERANDLDALALATLTEALLAQGRQDDAQKSAEQVRTLAEKSQDRNVRFTAAILGARVRALTGRPEDVAAALRSLESVRAEAAKLGYVAYPYQARLAAGEIELAAGRSAAGKARLQALAKEAEAKGFGLVARKASALSR
jgi:tetratricopeptide (TPR) repeat protein